MNTNEHAMKAILGAFAAALLVAACGGPEVVRETVVERPVVREKETVVERVPVPAAGATAPGCTYESQSYSHGSMSCQEGREFRCTSGIWERTASLC